MQWVHTMATFTQLPSGNWRAQVRKSGIYRNATFRTKAEARNWALAIESHATHVAASGFAPPPKGATLRDLLEKYIASQTKEAGKTKRATLEMLKRELGSVRLTALSAVVLRDFIDMRVSQGAGGVTIAADLSFLSAVLRWARHARRIDLPERLALEARESLKHRGLDTRSRERDREPTDSELKMLIDHWEKNARQRIDMPVLVRFALASGMRLGEICRIRIEDVDRDARTVVIRDRKDPRAKAGNDQTVPLLPAAWGIIAQWIDGKTHGLVFKVRSESASSAFTRACQALEIDDLRFHDLRHRATADFFRAGLDIPRVALLTGHKTWGMLRRYTSIKPHDVHQAFERGMRG